ncbi:MAG: metallophosphoesterase family protein [Lentisphaeria bacterium]|jgi:predicted phosphodiesterase
MKIGVFGDIHGNLAALEATLAAMREEGCFRYLCTGDIVGYGPSPHECLQKIRELGPACLTVLGNHDEYVTEIFGSGVAKLEPDTRRMIEWTHNQLNMDELTWLAALPGTRQAEGATLLHGSLGGHHWNYIVNLQELERHFARQTSHLAFCGHSHLPLAGLQAPGHPLKLDFLKEMTLPPEGKVLINPGAVGQPRDRDARAAFVVWNKATGEIQPCRVPYDIEATQKLMTAASLPERFITRLSVGR